MNEDNQEQWEKKLDQSRDNIHAYLTEALGKIKRQLDKSPHSEPCSMRLICSFRDKLGEDVNYLVSSGLGNYYAQLGSVDEWLRHEKGSIQ